MTYKKMSMLYTYYLGDVQELIFQKWVSYLIYEIILDMPTYDKSTSVLKQQKIEYFIDYGTPKMTFLFYFQPFIMDGL